MGYVENSEKTTAPKSMRTEPERQSFEGIFAEIGYHKTSDSWVIASSEIKNHLGKGIEWCKQRKKLSDALNGIANTDARSIKIVAHGDQDSITLDNRCSRNNFIKVALIGHR